MARIIAITSGKGGVGKTNISVNLAIHLARMGYKTCLFDADLGLANVNILLGLAPEFTLGDLIEGTCSFDDLLIRNVHGVDIIPGSTGVAMLADMGPDLLEPLIEKLSGLEEYDYILFDTSAGISKQVLSFCLAATHVIVTVVPEPTSLTDAYSLVKVLYRNGFDKPAYVIVNRSRDHDFAERVFAKFNATVKKFLPVTIEMLDSLREDAFVSEAVARQTPFCIAFPDCPASKGIARAAKRISQKEATASTMADFIRKTLTLINVPMEHVPEAKKAPKPEKPVVKDLAPPAGITHADHEGKAESTDDVEKIERDELVNQVLAALNTLVRNTERISEELSALRQDMEKRDKARIELDDAPKPALSQSPVITLDFEKYVRESHHKKA